MIDREQLASQLEAHATDVGTLADQLRAGDQSGYPRVEEFEALRDLALELQNVFDWAIAPMRELLRPAEV